MHDEIASHFAADINQMTLGHKWINDNLGADFLPRNAWHIDEQGHVAATAALVRTLLANVEFNVVDCTAKLALG